MLIWTLTATLGTGCSPRPLQPGLINNKIMSNFVNSRNRINIFLLRLKLIFVLIIASLGTCNIAFSQNADKPTTIKQSKKNIAKKKKKQAKLKRKAEKKAKKDWLKLQTKETRKRIKKNEKMNNRRRKGKKYKIY